MCADYRNNYIVSYVSFSNIFKAIYYRRKNRMSRTIKLDSVTKSYKGTMVLNNVTESFFGGHIYGIIGRNGSGKLCFLRLFVVL